MIKIKILSIGRWNPRCNLKHNVLSVLQNDPYAKKLRLMSERDAAICVASCSFLIALNQSFMLDNGFVYGP